MTFKDEELEKIAELLETTVEELNQNKKELPDIEATYFWNPIRGGSSIIVSKYGRYLKAGSQLSFEQLLEKYNSGQRNGSVSIVTSYVDMNGQEIKNLIKEKIELLKDKFNGIIDANEQENAGFLHWSCSMILKNIMMSSDKLLRKHSDELTSEETEYYKKLSEIITNSQGNWTSMEELEKTYNQIKQI